MGRAFFCFILGLCACQSAHVEPVNAAAKADLDCSWVEIREAYVSSTWVKAATGCGKENLYVANSEGKFVSPLERAELDLECDRKALTTARLAEGKVGVWGCGRRATYEFHKNEWVQHQPFGG